MVKDFVMEKLNLLSLVKDLVSVLRILQSLFVIQLKIDQFGMNMMLQIVILQTDVVTLEFLVFLMFLELHTLVKEQELSIWIKELFVMLLLMMYLLKNSKLLYKLISEHLLFPTKLNGLQLTSSKSL